MRELSERGPGRFSVLARRSMGIFCVMLVAPGLMGCGAAKGPSAQSAGPKPERGRLRVTCTTGMITDAAGVIGGEHVEVTGLMGPGVDPHLYKATQGDLKRLTEADLILYNGLHLEGKMTDLLVQMAQRVRTVAVTESIPEDALREPPEFAGLYDPHVWFDAGLWQMVAERIRDALVEADPAHKAGYEANAAKYLDELRDLDGWVRSSISSIPRESRVLITAHDAFGYFGRAYDIEVMGLQGISTASESGLHDITRLVDVIVNRKIKAVFIESSVPPQAIRALIRGAADKGHDVKEGGTLFSDAMGAADTPEGTYVGMVRHNVNTIVEALK